ncbi:MAG: glutathione ABC transporter permease GsiD [Litorilinea sp.]|nr:MAG: glutathione ABC transporter permease GsiD [Litorilinea sp.]
MTTASNDPNIALKGPGVQTRRAGYWQEFWRYFSRDVWAVIGLVILIIISTMAILAPMITPYDPIQPNFREARQPPSAEHWLGTDVSGMDVFSRLIYGSRISLSVAIVAVFISESLGAIIGLVSGYYGGWVDSLLQRITEVFMAFPTLMLMITLAAVLGPSTRNAMIIIGVFGWTTLSRLMRGQALSVRERDFIMAARVLGCKESRIISRHILPNTLGVLIVNAIYGIRNAILAEASLSFLGAGVPQPIPSWGSMVNFATNIAYLQSMPWAWVPSAIILIVVIASIGFVGDGITRAVRR